jgi:hypothetical protein
MFDDIRGSFPQIKNRLTAEESGFFRSLPEDYREFLQQHNGGFVDEFRYTFPTGVPFQTDEVDNPSRDDCPVEFYGLRTIAHRKGLGRSWFGVLLGLVLAIPLVQVLLRRTYREGRAQLRQSLTQPQGGEGPIARDAAR